jgi:phosphoserine phosphatase RsbU/P
MTRDHATALVRQMADAVNRHDTPRLLTLYAEDAVTFSPVAGQIIGIPAIGEWWNRIFSLFPDWTVGVSDVLVDGDRIAFFGMAAATDRNGWFGQPPTGERFEYRAIVVLTLRQGKIVCDERIYDLSGLLKNLEKARLDKELQLAAEVQKALLSQMDRSTMFCEVAGDSLPCRAIGGDFFEATQLSSGDLGIALGDVAGKGTGSALLAAMIQGMLAVQLESETSPSRTLAHLNRLLKARRLEPRFATLAYGVLSPTGRFICSSAGHHAPIVITRGGIRRPENGGPILGLFNEPVFEEEELLLSDGDTLIFFSDGVLEAHDTQDHEFGEHRLLTCLAAARATPVRELLQQILSSVEQFFHGVPQADDITVLVARFHGSQQA